MQCQGGERRLQPECGFWHPLSEDMATASKNGVYRLDWMMLIPEGPGKFKLTSGSGSLVQQQVGDVAEATRGKLAVAEDIQSLSTPYGRSREEKLKQIFSGGNLTTLHHIMHLDPSTRNLPREKHDDPGSVCEGHSWDE